MSRNLAWQKDAIFFSVIKKKCNKIPLSSLYVAMLVILPPYSQPANGPFRCRTGIHNNISYTLIVSVCTKIFVFIESSLYKPSIAIPMYDSNTNLK